MKSRQRDCETRIATNSKYQDAMESAIRHMKEGGRMESPHRVVIIGGGFGGLYAARALARAPAAVTLIDRRNHHLFQPLLYQVATGGLSPANIAAPLRGILSGQRNAEVLMAEVADFDVGRRCLILRDGNRDPLGYDTLIVATGSVFNYFGHDGWKCHAPGLKSIEDATDIRRRVLGAFEQAERETDPQQQRARMTFAIVGGGPTGVELAGALAEVAHATLRNDFRRIDPRDATILLLEAEDHLLGMFPADLRRKATDALQRLGVRVQLGAKVTDITPRGATVRIGDRTEAIDARVVLWTAGVKAAPLGAALAKAVGQTPDRAGRLTVETDLTLAGHPEIFVIGDLASFSHQTGRPLPGLAPVAMQQGRYAARVICRRLRSQRPGKAFHYRDRGDMATIGRGGGHRRPGVRPHVGLFCLAHLAIRAPDVPCAVPKPCVGRHSMVLQLFHPRPGGAIDHERSTGGSRVGGPAESCSAERGFRRPPLRVSAKLSPGRGAKCLHRIAVVPMDLTRCLGAAIMRTSRGACGADLAWRRRRESERPWRDFFEPLVLGAINHDTQD